MDTPNTVELMANAIVRDGIKRFIKIKMIACSQEMGMKALVIMHCRKDHRT